MAPQGKPEAPSRNRKLRCTRATHSTLLTRYTARAIKKLKTAYNNCYRILLNLPKYCSTSEMFANNNVCMFDALIRKEIYSLKCRAESSDNVLLHLIFVTDITRFSSWHKHVYNLLY